MAQVDKTFPTTDCAMCILSPKLVECGRHLNIQLMTMTELDRVEGELGNFTAHLRQHPRYVDVEKCIACGKCAESCPRETSDEFNQKINTRKAIFVKYPQVPDRSAGLQQDEGRQVQGVRKGMSVRRHPVR